MGSPFRHEKADSVDGPREDALRIDRPGKRRASSARVTGGWSGPTEGSMEGQDTVSDREILEFFRDEVDEARFLELLVRDYERILFLEDAEALAAFTRETVHLSGRLVPHFDSNGDGVALLSALEQDIRRAVAQAENDPVLRIRYAYSVYHDYASGSRGVRELVLSGYLSDFLPLAAARGGSRVRPARRRDSRSGAPRPPGAVIHRWTVKPPGVEHLGSGRIRIFTGQSQATLQAMIRTGLKPVAPRHPGRAHYGRGVYTSQQRPIAESYASQHERGVVAEAAVKLTNLKTLNVAKGPGARAFERYLESVPGLRRAWEAHENRYYIFEAFIHSYAPGVDIVIAPHGAGNQLVFRSTSALEALRLNVSR